MRGSFIFVDFNNLKRYGASYGKLPSSMTQLKCSGRDQLCNEVVYVFVLLVLLANFLLY